MEQQNYEVYPGDCEQGGATIRSRGVNFCVFTRFAESSSWIDYVAFRHVR